MASAAPGCGKLHGAGGRPWRGSRPWAAAEGRRRRRCREVAVRSVGEDGGDNRAGVDPGGPGGDPGDNAGAPAPADEAGAGQAAAAVHGLGRADLVDLVEGVVGDVARMDAAAEAAHQPGHAELPEDGWCRGVDADEPQRAARRTSGPMTPALWPPVPTRCTPGRVQVVRAGRRVRRPGRRNRRYCRGCCTGRASRRRRVRRAFRGRASHCPLPAAAGRRAVHDLNRAPYEAQQGRMDGSSSLSPTSTMGWPSAAARRAVDAEGAGLHHRGSGPQFARACEAAVSVSRRRRGPSCRPPRAPSSLAQNRGAGSAGRR